MGKHTDFAFPLRIHGGFLQDDATGTSAPHLEGTELFAELRNGFSGPVTGSDESTAWGSRAFIRGYLMNLSLGPLHWEMPREIRTLSVSVPRGSSGCGPARISPFCCPNRGDLVDTLF